ncbi:SAM-dependent methyltransferase [Hyphococcus sp.]|jgi:SAM-dependent methyltransferase|uniref:SAM-dependent methyltransferase n=1 Tax=Hyphococcus sp. TaxID=2038636 RepID=UPI003D0E387F
MYDIITKAEYWRWLENGINTPAPGKEGGLKHIQDTFILAALENVEGCKILEFGGGHSRLLRSLGKKNECWNADKFEGVGAGPTRLLQQRGVKTVKTFIGDFDERLPDGYFDYVFSISVMEHVPLNGLAATFADCARILKPGGALIQAIDLYLPDAIDRNDPDCQFGRRRISLYLDAAAQAGLTLKEPAALDGDACFRGSHASNSDTTMYFWNSVAPSLRAVRERAQSVALKGWWIKPEA